MKVKPFAQELTELGIIRSIYIYMLLITHTKEIPVPTACTVCGLCITWSLQFKLAK